MHIPLYCPIHIHMHIDVHIHIHIHTSMHAYIHTHILMSDSSASSTPELPNVVLARNGRKRAAHYDKQPQQTTNRI